MSSPTNPKADQPPFPSYSHLLLFFLPLALSSSLMTLEPLITNTALSRSTNAELALAAYDVMFGIALVIEAPVLMLVSASTALSQTQASFRRLFRFTLWLAGGIVALGSLVVLTPLYTWLLSDVMHIPPAVAEVARPAQIIMTVWPFPIAWRRTLQGVLISHDRTPVVTAATVVRLSALVAVLLIGSRMAPDQMLIVSAVAMQVAVLAESLVITGPALATVRRLPTGSGKPLFTWRWLVHYYQPLATMMILRQLSRPLLSAGIAAGQLPQRSLAAWSVAWSVALLPFGLTMGLEQVAITKGTTPSSLVRVRRFVWVIGLVLGGLLVLIAYTPLVYPVLDLMFNLTPEIERLVVNALRLMAPLPLLQSLQASLRGTAISGERTADVRSAVVLGLAAIGLVTLFGPRLGHWVGVIISATATTLAAIAEVGWLAWRDRRAAIPRSGA